MSDKTDERCPKCGAAKNDHMSLPGGTMYYCGTNSLDDGKTVEIISSDCYHAQVHQRDRQLAAREEELRCAWSLGRYREEAIRQIPDLGEDEDYKEAVARIVRERDEATRRADEAQRDTLRAAVEHYASACRRRPEEIASMACIADAVEDLLSRHPEPPAEPKKADFSYADLVSMLEDVVSELDLSEAALLEHGPHGTNPARLVRMVLDQKDKIIRCLKAGMVDVSEPPAEAALREDLLEAQGVFKGAHGLRGLAECEAFWRDMPYETRLEYGPGIADYLHRDVLRAAVNALDAMAAATARLEAVRGAYDELPDELALAGWDDFVEFISAVEAALAPAPTIPWESVKAERAARERLASAREPWNIIATEWANNGLRQVDYEHDDELRSHVEALDECLGWDAPAPTDDAPTDERTET